MTDATILGLVVIAVAVIAWKFGGADLDVEPLPQRTSGLAKALIDLADLVDLPPAEFDAAFRAYLETSSH